MIMRVWVRRTWRIALLAVVLSFGCRSSDTLARNDGEEVRARTLLEWRHENVDEWVRAQRAQIEENLRMGRPAGPHPGASGDTKAFAAKNRAVVRWWLMYQCGLEPTPKVTISQRTIRFGVTFGGTPGGGCGEDVIQYRTVIRRLPAGRYRIVGVDGYEGPSMDMMLDVPGRNP
jgi:hypothetical protein